MRFFELFLEKKNQKFSTLLSEGGGEGSDPSVEFSTLFFLTGSVSSSQSECNIEQIDNMQPYVWRCPKLVPYSHIIQYIQCICVNVAKIVSKHLSSVCSVNNIRLMFLIVLLMTWPEFLCPDNKFWQMWATELLIGSLLQYIILKLSVM